MADEGDKIVPLVIRPATHRFRHEGFTVVVTFNPQTKQWDWVATKPIVSKLEYEGKATTSGRALADAKRRIERGL